LSRRDFLLASAAGAAGVLAAACAPAAPQVIEVEKEVPVEKEVIKTVEVEKIVEVEVTPVPVPTGVEPIELVTWSLGEMDPDLEIWAQYQEAVHAIMEDRLPNVSIKNADMGWDEVLRQNLVTALMAGTAPDLTVGESFIQPRARIGAFLPLNEAFEEAGIMDNLIPGVQMNAVAEGKLYGVSLRTGVFAFESNPNVVEKAGLDPTVWPETWDELLERCAKITEAGDDEFFGYTLQGPVGFLVGGIMRYNVYAGAAGAPMYEDDPPYPYFDDPKLEPVLAFLRQINEYTPPGLTWNPDEGAVYQQLHQGVTAYQMGANWHLNWAREYGVDDVIQYGPIPLPKGGQEVSRTVGNKFILALSGTDHPREAIEFIKILLEDEVTVHVYEASQRTPSTYSGLEKVRPLVVPQHKPFVDIMESADLNCLPQWSEATSRIWAVVNEMMEKVLRTTEPIPQLQAEAQQAAEKAIAEA